MSATGGSGTGSSGFFTAIDLCEPGRCRCRCPNCGFSFLAQTEGAVFCSLDCRVNCVLRGGITNYPTHRPGAFAGNEASAIGGLEEGPLQREARATMQLRRASSIQSIGGTAQVTGASGASSPSGSSCNSEDSCSKPVPVPSRRWRQRVACSNSYVQAL
ncbi:hypothetical protein JKP88DRAFT_264424 [Tribonema minus]|uniref:Uncharacterized protein n=1 Tax=Tribonema minus TaxID=303371 RepID=A0A836CBL6_9STRA|nr:hypothetical protein JKP88DRAFT_264424 [Tribonema minus]